MEKQDNDARRRRLGARGQREEEEEGGGWRVEARERKDSEK